MTQPRLLPFPHEQFLVDIDPAGWETNTYYSDPANDGVQFYAEFGGSAVGWGNTGNSSAIGLANIDEPHTAWGGDTRAAVGMHYAKNGVPNVREYSVTGYNDALMTNTAVLARYFDNRNVYSAAVPVGRLEFPGVASIDTLDRGYINVDVCHGPVWVRMGLEDNPLKSRQTIGYSGYPLYVTAGRQLQTQYTGTIDGYYRRIIWGIVDQAADLATMGPADMEFGYIVTGTASGATLELVINRVVRTSVSMTEACIEPWVDPNVYWYGTLPEVTGMPQGWSYEYAALYGATQLAETASDTFHNLPYMLDTYGTDFGMYVDYVAATNMSLRVSIVPPAMFTHPAWPVTPPTTPAFWQDFVESHEYDSTVVVPPPPTVGFKAAALALDPYYYVDMEGLTTMPMNDDPVVMLVNKDSAAGSYWWPGSDSEWITGPCGNALYNMYGGWWGFSINSSVSATESFIQTGETIVKVFNAHNDPVQGAYSELNLYHCFSNSGDNNLYWVLFDIGGDQLTDSTTGMCDLSCGYIQNNTLHLSYVEYPKVPVATPFFADGGWHVAALTVSIALPNVTLAAYIDGVEIRRQVITLPAEITATVSPSASVSNREIQAASDSGAFDDFAFYDRVLTPEEIATLIL